MAGERAEGQSRERVNTRRNLLLFMGTHEARVLARADGCGSSGGFTEDNTRDERYEALIPTSFIDEPDLVPFYVKDGGYAT